MARAFSDLFSNEKIKIINFVIDHNAKETEGAFFEGLLVTDDYTSASLHFLIHEQAINGS